VDREIKGSLWGLLERGVQVTRDAEETADDYVMLSVGYASTVGTSLWAEIKEDRAKVGLAQFFDYDDSDPKPQIDRVVGGYSDVSESVDSIVSRLEDTEDDMQICKNDIDVLRIEQASTGSDIRMLEASMDSVHEQLEDLGGRMDGCVAAGRRTASIVEGNARFPCNSSEWAGGGSGVGRGPQPEVHLDQRGDRQEDGPSGRRVGQGSWACRGEDRC
jgi:hypothetical protein